VPITATRTLTARSIAARAQAPSVSVIQAAPTA